MAGEGSQILYSLIVLLLCYRFTMLFLFFLVTNAFNINKDSVQVFFFRCRGVLLYDIKCHAREDIELLRYILDGRGSQIKNLLLSCVTLGIGG